MLRAFASSVGVARLGAARVSTAVAALSAKGEEVAAPPPTSSESVKVVNDLPTEVRVSPHIHTVTRTQYYTVHSTTHTYIYIYTRIHTYTHTCIHTHTYIHTLWIASFIGDGRGCVESRLNFFPSSNFSFLLNLIHTSSPTTHHPTPPPTTQDVEPQCMNPTSGVSG